ncbi:hypothetical protein C0Q58_14460 [Streptomyces albidoflavus]|uniref:hypothetical protein n=1 Tax=Streptomyces albidoflavus TaxID=1886 RepID=UPI00101E37B8|nr:hypothetical protein [Streptomyces albidoflavus]RZD62939.1 hypothetical protein C0Q58_14460 [Streptomyces albidoflavus]
MGIVNVISSNVTPDVSEEYGEQVEALIAQGHLRETTQKNRHGQTAFTVRLHTYAAPGSGVTKWAVDYADEASRELEEFDNQEEADAHYEELVRDADSLGLPDADGYVERFTTTDVEGVRGPLPELPKVDLSDALALVDEVSEDPVLYVSRTEDGEGGEVELERDPAALVRHSQVVLTRDEVLEALDLADGMEAGKRVTRDEVTKVPDYDYILAPLLQEAQGMVRSVTDGLFQP